MSQGHNFLPKFLFVSNLLKAMKIREQVPNDVVKPASSGGVIHHLRTLHRHTVEMLPTGHFPQAFCQLVQGVLLDRAMQTSLEQEKKLNWCHEVKNLVPLRTNGEARGLGWLRPPLTASGQPAFRAFDRHGSSLDRISAVKSFSGENFLWRVSPDSAADRATPIDGFGWHLFTHKVSCAKNEINL